MLKANNRCDSNAFYVRHPKQFRYGGYQSARRTFSYRGKVPPQRKGGRVRENGSKTPFLGGGGLYCSMAKTEDISASNVRQ